MADYIASITYARMNQNNSLIAMSNDGDGDGSGLFVTEVIDSPTNSGKYATAAVPTGNTVVCTTAVDTVFFPDQFLFYFDALGTPTLIGQILSVSSATITLTANIIGANPSLISNSELGVSYSIVSPVEDFYIRISTQVVSGSNNSAVYIPNINTWRNTPDEGSFVSPSASSITQYSNIGNPLSISVSSQIINFRIITQNKFAIASPGFYWNSQLQLPKYIWLRVLKASTVQFPGGMAPSTMYRFSTDELQLNALQISVGFDEQDLLNAGYTL